MKAEEVVVTREQRTTLQSWVTAGKTEQRLAFRAQIILRWARGLAPIDHFHGKGLVATEELAALLQPKASDHLLDNGCGIGGPA